MKRNVPKPLLPNVTATHPDGKSIAHIYFPMLDKCYDISLIPCYLVRVLCCYVTCPVTDLKSERVGYNTGREYHLDSNK